MTAGFSLRKIKTPITLGQKLKRARKRLKFEVSEIEIQTKIRSKYIEALENDDFADLPADAYTRGFVTRYAKFLGLDENKSMEEYLRQRSKYRDSDSDYIRPKGNIKEVGFVVTPKLFAPISMGIVVLSLFTYLAFQISGFAAAPELSISSPNNNSVLEVENIEIKGTTNQQADVSVNDQLIQVSSDGTFSADYKLLPGINVIQVKSVNKANKEKSLTYTVEYKSGTAKVDVGAMSPVTP